MAQTGFTPIQLYSSSTPTNAPAAGNLTNDAKGSELAVNIADGKLFYKDTSNNVQTIADKTWVGTVTSVSGTAPVAVATGTSTPVISLSAGYGDTQNPYASKTANNFLAAPNGSSGVPTFRAIVAADIPTLNQNTTGSAATLTTARNLWGQSFNGSADISAPLYPAVGSVSLPAYSASGDTNTGIFFPAADTIAFAEGGVEAARFDASGNMGIGTTSPATSLTIFKQTAASNPIGSLSNPAVRLQTDASEFNEKAEIQFQAGSVAANSGEVIAAISSLYTTYNAPNNAGGALLLSTRQSTAAGGLTERMRIFASGGVSIGNTNDPGVGGLGINANFDTRGPQMNMYPNSDFEFVHRNAYKMLFYVNNASVVANLSITGVWTNASDARYKENIVDSQYGLDTVMALKPRAYNLIDQTDKPQIGFIAQEVLELVPEVVESVYNSITEEERYTLAYTQLIPVLTKAIQEQQAMIEALQVEVAALKSIK